MYSSIDVFEKKVHKKQTCPGSCLVASLYVPQVNSLKRLQTISSDDSFVTQYLAMQTNLLELDKDVLVSIFLHLGPNELVALCSSCSKIATTLNCIYDTLFALLTTQLWMYHSFS